MTGALQLRTEGLSVEFGHRSVLDDITMTAVAGQPVALTGPSGSGKTVLLHALSGLVAAARGRVLLDGVPIVSGTGAADRNFGVVLQSPGLASGLTAEENIALPLQARGCDQGDIASRVEEALATMDLAAAANRLVDDLSGGQRQRVGVARALAGRPRVVVADEPTAELDPLNRARVIAALLDPAAGRVVLIASNDPEVADACHHVLHLREGRLVPGG
jgi:putative ABC transport system ATP-binding protein